MRYTGRVTSLALVLFALVMKPSGPNRAVGGDCLYDCEGSICADYGNHSDYCGEMRAKCQARCSGKRWWGAIAYSAIDKGYGVSYEFDKVDDAKAYAMKRCNLSGKACKLQCWFENECGAVAADGKIVTWGTAFLKSDAQRRALEECRKAGGRACAIEAWSCSKM